MDTLETIYRRRSVRRFQERAVPMDLIGRVIDAGKMAPSDMNHQPWKFYVLTLPHTIHAFSTEIRTYLEGRSHLFGFDRARDRDPVFYGAAAVIFLAAPRSNEWAAIDVGMCAENMLLAARTLGLDSCPVGLGKYVDKTKIVATLGLDPRDQVLMAVVLGYGAETPEPQKRLANNVFFVL